MKLMITGASGFLGQAMVEAFKDGYRVQALGNRHAPGTMRSLDLRDAGAWHAELEAACPDIVIHCAAYRDPDFCEREQEETRRLNITPVRVLVDALPPDARLIFISTDYVFDGEHPPYHELDERRPINFYGQSKREAEDIALDRKNALVVRIPLLMGSGTNFAASGFIAKMITSLDAGNPTEWDHCTMRYPTDIRDVAAAVRFLLELDECSGVYHFSGRTGHTQYEWAHIVAAATGSDASLLVPVEHPSTRVALRPRNSHLATDRMDRLGWNQYTAFETVLEKILALRAAEK
jgi:S-adenosylmethionine synthetase